MKLRARKGICSSRLEDWCASLGCIQLIALLVAGMLSPGLLGRTEYECVFVSSIAMSTLLLVASIFRIRWMLLFWFVYALLLLIGIPYGVETFAGFFRVLYAKIVYEPFSAFVIEYVVFSALYIYIIRMVVSFYLELRDEEKERQLSLAE